MNGDLRSMKSAATSSAWSRAVQGEYAAGLGFAAERGLPGVQLLKPGEQVGGNRDELCYQAGS